MYSMIFLFYYFNFIFQKESLIFALYSTNWTEMDIKFKKLILLVMKINNAHQLKLKISPLNTVNLELFCKVYIIYYIYIQ